MSVLLPGQEVVAVPATSTATAAPSGVTDPLMLAGESTFARLWINYTGQVDTCVLRLWLQGRDGNWYESATTDQLEPLTPGGASVVDETRDWELNEGTRFYLQVAAISGGGTVAVRVEAVSK